MIGFYRVYMHKGEHVTSAALQRCERQGASRRFLETSAAIALPLTIGCKTDAEK